MFSVMFWYGVSVSSYQPTDVAHYRHFCSANVLQCGSADRLLVSRGHCCMWFIGVNIDIYELSKHSKHVPT